MHYSFILYFDHPAQTIFFYGTVLFLETNVTKFAITAQIYKIHRLTTQVVFYNY